MSGRKLTLLPRRKHLVYETLNTLAAADAPRDLMLVEARARRWDERLARRERLVEKAEAKRRRKNATRLERSVAVEDAQWDWVFARHPEKLAALAAEISERAAVSSRNSE